MKTSSSFDPFCQRIASHRRWERWIYGPRLARQRAPKRLHDQQYLYDNLGKLAYVVERHVESWQLLSCPQRALIGTYKETMMAKQMGQVLAAHAQGVGAAIKGERERDAKRVEKIRYHQQAEERRWQQKIALRRRARKKQHRAFTAEMDTEITAEVTERRERARLESAEWLRRRKDKHGQTYIVMASKAEW